MASPAPKISLPGEYSVVLYLLAVGYCLEIFEILGKDDSLGIMGPKW